MKKEQISPEKEKGFRTNVERPWLYEGGKSLFIMQFKTQKESNKCENQQVAKM